MRSLIDHIEIEVMIEQNNYVLNTYQNQIFLFVRERILPRWKVNASLGGSPHKRRGTSPGGGL